MKKINSKKLAIWPLYYLILISILFNGYSFIMLQNQISPLKGHEDAYEVGCGSDSMGLVFGCQDVVTTKKVDNLTVGNIYVYNRDGKKIIHRLVYCLDKDCNKTIFKGDNNKGGEFVLKSQIDGEVNTIKYNGNSKQTKK